VAYPYKKFLTEHILELSSDSGVAKRFDPRAEFATAWPLEGWIQWDLCDR